MNPISAYNPLEDPAQHSDRLYAVFLGLLLGLNNILIGIKVAGISIDRILEISLFFLFLPTLVRLFRRDGTYRIMVAILIGYVFLRQFNTTVVWLKGHEYDLDLYLRKFIKSFTYLIYFMLSYDGIRRHAKPFLVAYVWVAFGAGVLAFFQSPITPFTSEAWVFKMKFFGANANGAFGEVQSELASATTFEQLIRVSGPFGYVITYSYALFTGIALSIYVYINTRKKLFLGIFFFLVVISVLTLTRSLILATGIVGLALARTFSLKQYVVMGVMAIALFFYLDGPKYFKVLGESRLQNFSSDKEARRDLLSLCGLETVIRYPLGITPANYDEVRREYFERYNNHILLIGVHHNGFISLGFTFTILGMFLFFYFLWVCRWFWADIRKEVKWFFLITLGAYVIHSIFHNSFIFVGDYNIMTVVALFCWEAQMMRNRKRTDLIEV